MVIVNKIISNIVVLFTHICNTSFNSGLFPSKMKVAKVIPVYKAGDFFFTNYIPVSQLPQFSNIFKKIFNIRLDTFIETCEMFK